MTEHSHLPIIIRQSPEMHLKSWRTRRKFRNALRRNLRAALGGIPHGLRVDQGRLLLRTPEPEAATEVLTRVFGISSFSPVEAMVQGEVEAICRVAEERFTEVVRGRTYAVRCTRQGEKRFSTQEIERRVGAVLDGPGRVDLERPEVVVGIELQQDGACLHARRIPGAGGLPVGVQGRALALISGGFDSAVAAWYAMRRGTAVDFVFCNVGGAAHEHLVVQVARLLVERWAGGTRPRLFVVDFRDPVADLKATLPEELWQVLIKRLMYRAACGIAHHIQAQALVTGEALSQVSSQTLSNLNSIDAASDLPVLRPLIGFDKQEIMDRAREIGTFALSEGVPEFCALTTARPVVSTRRDRIDHHEAHLDGALLRRAVEAARERDLLALSDEELVDPGIFTDSLPAEARILDCRPRSQYREWHLPGAENHPADELAEGFGRLPREDPYLLYCSRGTQAAVLAERLQAAGYRARAFRGDLARLKRAWVHSGADTPA
ncbi:MAG: tRNA uracil 4-sulfurtransferase ThiI [Ectothiorhodospira sp.]